jgi:hypothetical protein
MRQFCSTIDELTFVVEQCFEGLLPEAALLLGGAEYGGGQAEVQFGAQKMQRFAQWTAEIMQ